MPIRTAIVDRIAEIVLDHPPVNALDSAGWNELPTIVHDLSRNPEVRCLLVRGEGKGFCGGVDIKEMQAHPERIVELNRGNFLTFKAIRSAEVPVVTAVHGFVIGGGIGICGASDVIIAAEDAYFSLPEVDRGAMGGASHLLRMLPVHKVRAAFFTAGRIPRRKRTGSAPSSASCLVTSCSTRRARSPPRSPPRVAGHSCWPRKRSTVSSLATSIMAIVSSRGSRSRCTCIRIRRRHATRSSSTRARRSTETHGGDRPAIHAGAERIPGRSPRLDGGARPADAARDARRRVGFEQHRVWERTLATGNYGCITWPTEYGGRGANLIEWLIFEEEYYRARAPAAREPERDFPARSDADGVRHALSRRPGFCRRWRPATRSGHKGWSEPQAGSDLAAIRATATRDGDDYVLRGHKIWSSRAAFADWCFAIFRTDPASERHRGLTFILLPLKHEGVRVRGIRQIHGEPGFAEIFFEDARVPVANRLGAEGQGWHIAMATAGFERGLMLRSPARFQAAAQRLLALYRRHAHEADPAAAAAVAQAWMDAEGYALNTYMTASRLMAGGSIGVEASLNKIFWSELDVHLHRAAMSLLGARAELLPVAPASNDADAWLDGFIFSLAGPVYAGTNEIQAQHHCRAAARFAAGQLTWISRSATSREPWPPRYVSCSTTCARPQRCARRTTTGRTQAMNAGRVSSRSASRACSRRKPPAVSVCTTSTSCSSPRKRAALRCPSR
jgi:alkylation response protein AidB-like acyl-CoA dehydrogenase